MLTNKEGVSHTQEFISKMCKNTFFEEKKWMEKIFGQGPRKINTDTVRKQPKPFSGHKIDDMKKR